MFPKGKYRFALPGISCVLSGHVNVYYIIQKVNIIEYNLTISENLLWNLKKGHKMVVDFNDKVNSLEISS